MTAEPASRFADNILHFGRTLRAAGLPVGPAQVALAIRAVEIAGVRRRDDFYWTLAAVLTSRREHRDLFDQAFHVFWRNPRLLEKMLGMLLPRAPVDGHRQGPTPSRRLAEALAPEAAARPPAGRGEVETEIRADLTWSDREVLRMMDFESMSGRELVEAKRTIAAMRLPIMEVPTRRYRPARQGPRIDMRATLRASLRSGAAGIPLKRREVVKRHPPLVVLCDISGSMARYARLLLHFVHALTNDRDRVHTFLFGTRLTNVTRHLRHRDVDIALEQIGRSVTDWSGGTRIGAALHSFNTRWSRRVLAQGAVVLLISDGLDRDEGAGLAAEMDRLRRSCRRLVWLNPLLRWSGFEPKSAGVRIMLPHVDEFRPVHNLASLSALAAALSGPSPRREAKSWEASRNV